MFSYWTEQMTSIQAFKALKPMMEESGRLMSPLGLTKTREGVELHFLEASTLRHEPVFMEFEKPETHREQMKAVLSENEEPSIWAKKVFLGSREVLVKGAQRMLLDATQMKGAWILGEAFRQGWRCEVFEKEYDSGYYISSMKLDIEWTELEKLLEISSIRLERDAFFKSFLVEKSLELPIQEIFSEPVKVCLEEICLEKDCYINIQGIDLRDIWKDFEDIYEHHRLSGAISEADLDHFMKENVSQFEQLCPRGMRFPIVTYEADPDISIECYTTAYLESPVIFNQSGSGFGIGFIMASSDDVGSNGLPLRLSVIQQPLSPETKRLEFEIFKVNKRTEQEDLLFKVV